MTSSASIDRSAAAEEEEEVCQLNLFMHGKLGGTFCKTFFAAF